MYSSGDATRIMEAGEGGGRRRPLPAVVSGTKPPNIGAGKPHRRKRRPFLMMGRGEEGCPRRSESGREGMETPVKKLKGDL